MTKYVCQIFFAVTVEDLQFWWESMRTRFGKLTGHCSGGGARELTGHDKYIFEKLQFLERHKAHVPSQQTCSVSVKFIYHQICQQLCNV